MGIGFGHFEVVVKDSMGITKEYRQSDNAVVNGGENCVAKMIFRDPDAAGTTVCTGATTEGWHFFCLDEDAQVMTTDAELRNAADEAGLAACAEATITWNQNSTGGSDALSKVTLRLARTFTNGGAGAETINAVGIFNGTTASSNGMLAKANFTGVSVSVGSDLTVNYDFEVGGGTVP